MKSEHEAEAARNTRFAFGENWLRFLQLLDEDRIRIAEQSILELLGVHHLRGKRFLDVGSGSGLSSLAARRLGASVHSFDFDSQSVSCTEELKPRFFPDDADWTVQHGSILNTDYVRSLERWDIVYSWGVLHHTGAMWQALGNVASLVASGGDLCLAIYNDQGRPSRFWFNVKKLYNDLPAHLRWLVLAPAAIRLWGPTTLRDLVAGHPFQTWRTYARRSRGMSPWRDVVDWVGGFPFEVAKPEEIFTFYQDRGFRLCRLRTCAGGIGCNEFVFQAPASLEATGIARRSVEIAPEHANALY